MATDTTTVETIRGNMESLVRGLTPSSRTDLAFRAAVQDQDFAELVEAGQFKPRTFDIEDLGSYAATEVSDLQKELMRTTFEVRIAYPKGTDYGGGRTTRRAAMDMIREDLHLIDAALGIRGAGSYSAGQTHSIRQSKDPIVETESAWLLVLQFDVGFYRTVQVAANTYTGVADFALSLSMSAAGRRAAVGTAAISASATATAAATRTAFGVASISGALTMTAAGSIAVTDLPGILGAADPGQELIDIMEFGTAPTLMWDCTVASGADELITGTDDLSDKNSPTKQLTDATLGADVTQIDADSEEMEAASSSVADITTNSFALLWVGRFDTTATGNRSVVGKRAGWPLNGYEFNAPTANYVTFTCGDGTTNSTVSVNVDHGTTNAQVVLMLYDATANSLEIYSREGSSTNGVTFGSITSTQLFSIGKNRQPSARYRTGMVALWDTSAAESLGETERSNLATFLGYE